MTHFPQNCGTNMDCVTRFAFEGDCRGQNKWQRCNFEIHELTKVFRQSKREFVDLLQHIRKGMVQSRHLEVSTRAARIDSRGQKFRVCSSCACVRCLATLRRRPPMMADVLS